MSNNFLDKKDLFATFIGSSMYPTLKEPEIIELKPYENRKIYVGDVIFFLPPKKDKSVIHRVIKITDKGIKTRGDNNSLDDDYFLQMKDIKGQVISVIKNDKERKIYGGFIGNLIGKYLHYRKLFFRVFSKPFRPFYRLLLKNNVIAVIMPVQPKILSFQADGQRFFKIALGRRIIGRYGFRKQNGILNPFFRLTVDFKKIRSNCSALLEHNPR